MRRGRYRIVFVCTGNSCRSPMAEGILRRKLPDDLRRHVSVRSAGTLGIKGQRATPLSMQAAREHGVDISHHRSRGLDASLIGDADVVFAMAPEHLDWIQTEFPEARDKTFLLRSFDRAGEQIANVAIEDPIGFGLETYRRTYREIEAEIDRIMPRLTKLVRERLAIPESNAEPCEGSGE